MAAAVSKCVGHRDPWMHSLSALANLTLCLGVNESSADGVRVCSMALVDSVPDPEGVGAVALIVSFFSSGVEAVSKTRDVFFSLALGEGMSRSMRGKRFWCALLAATEKEDGGGHEVFIGQGRHGGAPFAI